MLQVRFASGCLSDLQRGGKAFTNCARQYRFRSSKATCFRVRSCHRRARPIAVPAVRLHHPMIPSLTGPFSRHPSCSFFAGLRPPLSPPRRLPSFQPQRSAPPRFPLTIQPFNASGASAWTARWCRSLARPFSILSARDSPRHPASRRQATGPSPSTGPGASMRSESNTARGTDGDAASRTSTSLHRARAHTGNGTCRIPRNGG